MLNVYNQNGRLKEAKLLFDRAPMPDTVSWNSMITAYAQNGYFEDARLMFDGMRGRDLITWNLMITAFVRYLQFDLARKFFDRMPKRNEVAWNCLISTFAEAPGLRLEDSKALFDVMPSQNSLSWTRIFNAYAQAGHILGASAVFERMPLHDAVSSTAMITAFAQNGMDAQARRIFLAMEERDLIACNVMILLYARAGHLDQAKEMFDSTQGKAAGTWNALAKSFLQNAGKALFLFRMMNLVGVAPDRIAFATILAWCSHSGLVNEALTQFVSMRADFGLTPTREHYCCVVDILARSGQLDSAEEVTDKMPFAAHGATWGSLLAASTFYENDDLAARAAEKIVEFRPECGSPYVLVANLHAAGKRQDYI
ncbi:hypothetical protein SELMODRAFT_118241 [Selaginella moellendorffii]|uniref:Pentacotripeptide-repeat region of PRORP domain-containing protein n=1 Tax=Selaginella moellendorffii TaxID=88036 RepID=D8SJC7_SELML|nr:hypothetical protein SELMODRAFT_118241 [Selaginella moellendorffii]